MNTGSLTPNIGIYIPASGEEMYSEDFASGMVNVDQHDHSGGPNKGLPIATEGLGAFSVTFDKLATNVVDPTTGIGTSGVTLNQIVLLDPLKSIFQLAPAAVGFLTLNGNVAAARTFQNSATITWSNPDGTGNPSASVIPGGIFPVAVADGGTGLTSLTPFAILVGGTTGTGNVQQVAGEGIADEVLTSNGPGFLPAFKPLPTPAAQNFLIQTLTLNAAQFTAITSTKSTNVVLVPAQGAGKVVVVNSVWAKVTVGSDRFHGGSSVHLYWGTGSTDVGFNWVTGSFTDTTTGYYYPDRTLSSSTTVIPDTTMENRDVTIGINSSSFTGGAGSTVSFYCTYSIMQI